MVYADLVNVKDNVNTYVLMQSVQYNLFLLIHCLYYPESYFKGF